MRAAHLHFMVTAENKRTLVTHIFVRGDELLARDTVFGVKDSLIRDFPVAAGRHPHPRRARPARPGLDPNPIRHRPRPQRGGRLSALRRDYNNAL